MANQHARDLRKSMTPQEVRLWLRLRLLRPQNMHFRRQVPLAGFIVDFACLRARVVVEIDGAQHGMPRGQSADARRDAILEEAGFLGFWNLEVDQAIAEVAEAIYRATAKRLPSPSVASRHLPLAGKDEVLDRSSNTATK
jgi:very-short-patch-repair endonuclease